MELSSVLLLQPTDSIHVDRVELRVVLLLIDRELLLPDGLQANTGLAHTDNNDTAALGPAGLVLLIGEGDANLGDVVGRVGRRERVREHGLAVLADNEDARPTVLVGCLDRETRGVEIGIRGRFTELHHLLLLLDAAEVQQSGGKDKADNEERENTSHHPDGVAIARVIVVVVGIFDVDDVASSKKVLEGGHVCGLEWNCSKRFNSVGCVFRISSLSLLSSGPFVDSILKETGVRAD